MVRLSVTKLINRDSVLIQTEFCIIFICNHIVKLGSTSGPGQVQVGSRSGSGQLHVNSKSFNIKVYFKSLRDLDLELVAIIAMPPPPPPTKLF